MKPKSALASFRRHRSIEPSGEVLAISARFPPVEKRKKRKRSKQMNRFQSLETSEEAIQSDSLP